MENLRVLEGSEVFFRGLQHLNHFLTQRNSKCFTAERTVTWIIKEGCETEQKAIY